MNPLTEIRERAGFKQIDVAKKLNIAQSTVSMWESGDSYPRAKILLQLATLLNVTEGEIIESIMAAKNSKGSSNTEMSNTG